MTELEIYRRALERIANLPCVSSTRYVGEVDKIVIAALVAGENVDDAGVVDNVIPRSVPGGA